MLDIQKQGQRIKKVLIPVSVEEAVTALAELGPRGRLIAGGTDLMIELDRNQRPGVDTLIDLTRIPGLDKISQTEDGMIHIGAGVTHNQIVDSDLVVAQGLPLAQACWEVGSPQLRNRATLAGNLVTASPANDTLSALLALDALLTLRSVRGERNVSIAEFFKGVRHTTLEPDEMLVDIAFQGLREHQRAIFVKLGLRRAQAISVVHLAVRLDLADGSGGAVKDARVALGSVAPTVVRVPAAEEYLVGKVLDDQGRIDEAAKLIAQHPRPIDDLRGTADYRTHMLRVMAQRALQTLAAGRERERWPADPVQLWGKTDGRAATGAAYGREIGDDDTISLTVNGRSIVNDGAAGKSLLDWLREDVELADGSLATGTKEGCAEGECGACTVFMDGQAVLGCLIPAARADQTEIVTVEGLSEADGERLHPIQSAFVETGGGAVWLLYPRISYVGGQDVGVPPRSDPRPNPAGI